MRRDIVVIGASAGGVQALQKVVADLPPDFPAAVFVVVHIPAWAPSNLPAILSRSGPLPAEHAQSDQPIRPGRIYVAPPDHHLVLEEQRMMLWRGPRENHQRPSINALFRSAAAIHKQRVVGMVLSGYLDDGTAGLWWVKRFGGVAVVQDPRDAAIPDMPQSVLEHVSADYVIPLSEAGRLLSGLVDGAHGPERQSGRESNSMENSQSMNATCPECRGPLVEVRLHELREYRCLVGHAFSARALLQTHSDTQEKSLWSAVVALEESSNLVQAVANDLPPAVVERLRQQAAEKQQQAGEIRRILEKLEPFDVGQ